MKEKIGIFGCTADPFTLAHREIVKQVLKQKLVDAVIIVPTIVDYHREGKTTWLTSSEKVHVIKSMTNDLGLVYIDDSELKRKAICEISGNELKDHALNSWRFIDTLMRIRIECMVKGSDKAFYPIIGGDEFKKFKTWFAWKEIIRQSDGLIVVERQGQKIDKSIIEDADFDNSIKTISIDKMFANISASEIRKYYKDKLVIDYLNTTLDWIDKMERKEVLNKDNYLLHTPIFDVVKGKKTKTGLEPILIDAPDWVMIIVRKNESFLVEKQFRYGCNNEILEFPCGIVEKNEKPFDAAMRELQEETGIKIIDSHKVERLGVVNPNPAFMMNRIHLFYVNLDEVAYAQVGQKLDTHEKLTYKFMDDFSFKQYVIDHAYDGVQPAMLMSALWLYENV